MPPRPVHRWKSFWLGIIVLVFLGWAWERSIHFGEMVVFGVPAGPSTSIVGQSRGLVSIATVRSPALLDLICCSPIAGNHLSKVSAWRNPHGTLHYDIPAAAEFERQEYYWSFSLSHWLLILLFVATWLASLRCRWRRIDSSLSAQTLGLEGARQSPPIFGTAGHE